MSDEVQFGITGIGRARTACEHCGKVHTLFQGGCDDERDKPEHLRGLRPVADRKPLEIGSPHVTDLKLDEWTAISKAIRQVAGKGGIAAGAVRCDEPYTRSVLSFEIGGAWRVHVPVVGVPVAATVGDERKTRTVVKVADRRTSLDRLLSIDETVQMHWGVCVVANGRAEQFITLSDVATGARLDPIVLQIALTRSS